MKVLHVIDTADPHPGSIGVLLPGWLSALAEKGIAVEVVCGAAHDPGTRDSFGDCALTVVDEEDTSSAAIDISGRIDEADLVHLHGICGEIHRIAAALAVKYTTPMIVSPYGQLHARLQRKGRVNRWFELRRFRKRFGRAELLCGFSQAESEWLAGVTGLKCQTLALGINALDSLVAAHRPHSKPLELPWSNAARILLYLGDIDGGAGLVPFLKACDQLEDEMESWRVLLAGRPVGHWLEILQAGARRHGKTHLGEFIVYPDFCQQKSLIDRAQIVVCPATRPVPPVSALWALAEGKPVLISRGAGLDQISQVDAGQVAEPNRKGFLAAMERLITQSRDELAESGARGRCFVEEHFSSSKLADALVRMYQETLFP